MIDALKYLIAVFAFVGLLCGSAGAGDAEVLVLMHEPGRVERYDLESGAHRGTLLSGLPPANVLLLDADGRLLISTGLPGPCCGLIRAGTVATVGSNR